MRLPILAFALFAALVVGASAAMEATSVPDCDCGCQDLQACGGAASAGKVRRIAPIRNAVHRARVHRGTA